MMFSTMHAGSLKNVMMAFLVNIFAKKTTNLTGKSTLFS